MTTLGQVWVGDFTGSGSAEVLAVSQGVGNWQLGTLDLTRSQSPTLTLAGIGNTLGFGILGNTVWQGRFSGGDHDQLLFYNGGDSSWWLGAVTNPGPKIGWTQLATENVGWLPNAGSWVCDRNGTGADAVVAYNAQDSSWWEGALINGSWSWTKIGQTTGLPAVRSAGKPAGNFTGAGEQLLGYKTTNDGTWYLITLSSTDEPAEVQMIPAPTMRFTTFSNDVARLWLVAPFGPGGADSIITCNLVNGDWLNGSITSPNGPESPAEAEFVVIGNSAGSVDLLSAQAWVGSVAGGLLWC